MRLIETSTVLKPLLQVSASRLSLRAAALVLRERSLIRWEVCSPSVFVIEMLLLWEGRTVEERCSEVTTTGGAQVLSRRGIKESGGEKNPAVNNGNVFCPPLLSDVFMFVQT